MGFHFQAFPDKSFHTHRPRISFRLALVLTERIMYPISRCVSILKRSIAFWGGAEVTHSPVAHL
jgi:hypothetical protein